jgi:hypothetical protein
MSPLAQEFRVVMEVLKERPDFLDHLLLGGDEFRGIVQ